MHITILNFQRTKVESVIETLQLQSQLNHEDSIKEITLQDFFSDSLYDLIGFAIAKSLLPIQLLYVENLGL